MFIKLNFTDFYISSGNSSQVGVQDRRFTIIEKKSNRRKDGNKKMD